MTAEGRILHERVHEQEGETRAGVRIERGLPLRSLRLGLVGVADVVEFHPQPEAGGGLSRWSTSGASPSRTIATRSSYAPRPCVWRK